MNLTIQPRRALIAMISVTGVLLVANILSIWSRFSLGHDFVFGLVPLFDFNQEMNIPTFYSTFILVLASLLLLCIGKLHRRAGTSYLLWYFLAGIFLFLALDENTGIHELLQDPMSGSIDATGLLFHAWVIPYLVLLALLAAFLRRFVWGLPIRTRNLFIAAGALFVAGAIGIEMVSGSHLEEFGADWLYYAMATLEELCEMLGIALFVYALLAYMETEQPGINITVGKQT